MLDHDEFDSSRERRKEPIECSEEGIRIGLTTRKGQEE
jgi:hypothetical protein